MSGTSMAYPHVCGFVETFLYHGANVRGDNELRKILQKYVIDIGVPDPDSANGLGFLTYVTKEEFAEMLGRISCPCLILDSLGSVATCFIFSPNRVW